MIPPRANQILEKLSTSYPEIVFKWENDTWPFLDSSPCTLSAHFKSDKKEDKVMLFFTSGISEHTVEDHIDGIKNHLISKLKQ